MVTYNGYPIADLMHPAVTVSQAKGLQLYVKDLKLHISDLCKERDRLDALLEEFREDLSEERARLDGNRDRTLWMCIGLAVLIFAIVWATQQ